MSDETPRTTKATKLKDRRSYPDWIADLRWQAQTEGIWDDLIDPNAPDAPAMSTTAPRPPKTIDTLIKEETEARCAAHQVLVSAWEESSSDIGSRGMKPPSPAPATYSDIEKYHAALQREYSILSAHFTSNGARYRTISNWIRATVDHSILTTAQRECQNRGVTSLQELVRALQRQLAPSDTSSLTSITQTYQRVLSEAEKGSVNPSNWFYEWLNAYNKAKLFDVPIIKGPTATIDFLTVLSKKIAPKWAGDHLTKFQENDELGNVNLTLDQYGQLFSRMAFEHTNSKTTGAPGIFSTHERPAMLGDRSDAPEGSSKARGRSKGRGDSKTYPCPCREDASESGGHYWKPIDCSTVEIAITGKTERQLRSPPNSQTCKEIVQRILTNQWKQLKPELEKKYGIKVDSLSGASKEAQPARKYPGNFNAAIMDPMLLSRAPGIGIYATQLNFSRHPFAQSTLLDNCGAMHVVNDRALLNEGSFVQARAGECVEAGTTQFPISGRGTRTIRNVINGEKGKKQYNLELKDVAVVEGFHVNIVSEARLREKGAWYHGFDQTLRLGNELENVVLCELESRYNLVFLEYKPLSTYLGVPSEIPTSASGILMFPTLERKIRARFRRSREYLQPRSDSEEKWHARAGHLGPDALRKLVDHARNVLINGPSRTTCEHCAKVYAKQVISRRVPERRSPRPFWRVQWDLFDFPVGFDGSSWILVIKDEYSGKLFGYLLPSKEGVHVFNTLREFELWVKRQFSLAICVMKHDQEKAVIPVRGLSAYQKWAVEQGIEIELTPSYTHEPNGGSERAGQEIINKSIAMREGAGLPEKLWPEATLAAIFLFNISPSYSRGWSSPNEVLDSWFRNYFRWYDPALITRLTTDLRPNWNGIYVYGARAYPMIKEREAGRNRRAYKVIPRGHIGYLVGYVASNIYRIWVPVLDQVIVTRNVTFDENILYSEAREQEEGQPIAIIRDVIELIEEDEIQDAGSIFENVIPESDTQLERTNDEPTDLGGEAPPLEETLITEGGQDSGVGSSKTADLGLLTPDTTPEPENMPGTAPGTSQRSRGTGQTEIGSLSPVNEVGEPGREVHLPEATEETASYDRAQSTIEAQDQPTDAFEQPLEPGSMPGTAPRIPWDMPGTAPGAAEAEERSESGELESSERAESEPAAKPRQKNKKRPLPKTREGSFQTRSSGRRDQGSSGGAGSSSVIVLINALLETMGGSTEIDHLNTLLSSIWPDQLREQEQGENHRTVHAVIAASVQQKTHPNQPTLDSQNTRRIHCSEAPSEPKSWNELENHVFGAEFKADSKRELENLEQRQCWRTVPSNQTSSAPIPLKWVFTYKTDSDGFITRFRSRIVVRGDLQEESSILSTYAATLAARSFRIAIALAAHFDLEMKQYDVVNAFVNAVRGTEGPPVICQLPPGYKVPGYVVEVDRALYGLRDSPALWYKDWTGTLKRLGLVVLKEEPCIYVDALHKVFVVFFVDDIQILYHRSDEALAMEIMNGIQGAYELTGGKDVEWFLGVRVIRDRAERKIWLVHDTYIQKIASKFSLADGKSPSTPLPGITLLKYEGEAHPRQVKAYQEKVGSVLYTAIMIRPDIAFAASVLSQFLTNPGPEHLSAVDWTIRYLFGTRFLALAYDSLHRETQLFVASDASFADDPETRRSSHGYSISLFGGLIIWKAARQSTVTTSSTESELLGVALTAKELMALQRLFRDLRLDLGQAWTILCDNQQTIRLIVGENERISTKLRHVDIQNMWLRQEHSKGVFKITYVPTNDMPADGFTKNLSRQKFEHWRAILNLQDVRARIETIE